MVDPVAGRLRRARQRGVLPALSFDLLAGLVATLVAGSAYVLALSAGRLPGTPFSIILFTIAPVCGLLALPVLLGRGRAERDPALEWAGAGLAVACLALLLQLASYPTVVSGGGLLRTSNEGSALLYLMFHLWWYACCLAGGLQAGRRRLPLAIGVGVVLTFLEAVDWLPTPDLVTDTQAHTRFLTGAQGACVLAGVLTVTVWVRAAGRRASPLRAWVGVSLLLSTYDVALNMLAGRRFSALWWSGLSLRAAAFAALAAGSLGYLLRQSRQVERFSAAQLDLLDSELRRSLELTDRLLTHARDLARSHSPEEVAREVCRTVQQLTGAPRVTVAHRDPVRLEMILLASTDPSPASRLPVVTEPVYVTSAGEIARTFAELAPRATSVQAMAVLPLRAADQLIGTLSVEEDRPRQWSESDRELLEGLAGQAGPVLSRARLAAREHRAAETLQHSLMPHRLPTVPGLELTVRYSPADRDDRVGGDWYDGWTLPDGRVALVMGDVVGKGLAAAAITGRLRAAIRALSSADPSPSRVLTQLDQLEAGDTMELVATVLFALFAADLDSVRIARAGHPPAILIDPGRGAALLTAGDGAPIGLGAQPITETTIDLQAGATILLYTDGLIEDRSRPIDERLRELLAAVQDGPQRQDPDRLATYLVEEFRARRDDDVALLMATRRPAPHDPVA